MGGTTTKRVADEGVGAGLASKPQLQGNTLAHLAQARPSSPVAAPASRLPKLAKASNTDLRSACRRRGAAQAAAVGNSDAEVMPIALRGGCRRCIPARGAAKGGVCGACRPPRGGLATERNLCLTKCRHSLGALTIVDLCWRGWSDVEE